MQFTHRAPRRALAVAAATLGSLLALGLAGCGGGGGGFGSSSNSNSSPVTPSVTAVAPNSGAALGGTTVTLTGVRFTGATAVKFGAASATNVVVNGTGTQITATSPAGTSGTTVDITVTSPSGTSPTVVADKFTYGNAPAIMSVAPTTGTTAGGTSVTITGANLTGATGVAFGGTAATNLTVNSATSITVTSPAHAVGQVDITVSTPNGTSPVVAGDQFTYTVPVPTITSISPIAGPTAGGTSVTINGTNFTGATGVTFGGTAATNVVVNGVGTSITATSPTGAAGTVDVVVTAPGATSATSAADQFTYDDVPTVTSSSPTTGPDVGGTTITINGTNFVSGQTTVFIGGNQATNVVVTSSTQITATTPAGIPATSNAVYVITPGGTSNFSPNDFDYP